MAEFGVKRPELLRVEDDGIYYVGGNQEWYDHRKNRLSGCGPTAVSNSIYYLAQTGEIAYEGISPGLPLNRDGFLALMKDVIRYVTPSMLGGLPSTRLLCDGLERLMRHEGINRRFMRFNAASFRRKRPYEDFAAFLVKGFERDSLPMFLTLSGGEDKEVETWHWINMLAFDPETEIATICDNHRIYKTNLRRWHETSKLGGGAVFIL